jgi:hypothetical protein
MPYKISYSSILYTDWDQDSEYTGSSKYKFVNGELKENKRKKNEKVKPLVPEKYRRNRYNSNDIIDTEEYKEKKYYKLNKSKVRKKCIAFSRLKKSKKFLAFYSISFPIGLNDDKVYKLFNLWLTRCRKDSDLKSYLWVVERQKNVTLHFHLLTNDFMKIQNVNSYMAKSLGNLKKKGIEALKEIDTEIYNGVDVKKVGKNKNALVRYLTKYITKNDIKFYRLPWHCSRDISRLFTDINFKNSERNKYFDMIPDNVENYNIYERNNFKVAGFKFRPNEEIYSDLDIVNEIIYNSNLER